MSAIYALEILLKVKICERLELDYLPAAFEIHDLEGLLVMSGLSKKLMNSDHPPALQRNWDSLRRISGKVNIELRYSGTSKSQEDTLNILGQVNGEEGLIPWLVEQK